MNQRLHYDKHWLVSAYGQIETLQNVVLTLDNPTFRAKYSYVATASEQQLSQALARVIGELDPLLIEALA